jgi:threonine/homoserine/homoserine lactone efflux protein
MTHTLWAFLGISIVVIVIPGPDTALTIRNSLTGGRIGGIATALGVVAGQLVWEFGTAAGLTAILLASEKIFHFIKLAGAVYLVILGAQALIAAIRSRARHAAGRERESRPAIAPRRAFHQGLISNLGNPKMAVFFASIFPQFAPRGHETFGALMSLGVVFSSLTLVWLVLYAVAISRAAGFFRRPAVERTLEGISGAALIGVGARLALERD